MEAFEDLDVWKRSSRLAIDIYKSVHHSRDYILKDQITRSAFSISSNIAEGYERNSNRQFIQFLKIAKGSCGELRSQLYICKEIEFMEANKTEYFLNEAREISRMIYGLIRYCQSEK